ncbi:MAG: TonB-dependent receptor [Ekhidna sp.]
MAKVADLHNFMSVSRFALIIAFLLMIAPKAVSQEVLARQVTLQLNNVKLEEALEAIANKADISFSYSTRNIPVDQEVSITVTNQNLSEVLDQLFSGMRIEYVWVEDKMILRKSKKEPSTESTKYTVSGYVTDQNDGETLIGATILVEEQGIGTIANAYGFYSLTLPAGNYTLKYSYIGYENQSIPISLQSNQSQNINLEANSSMLQEVVVTVDDSVQTVDHVHSNVTQLSNTTILQKPSVLGEPDVIKSLDILPGIQLFNDGSAFFNVRGGNRDQNQILVDEAPIYNPSHLLGLYSSFTPEAIKDIKIYKGNASADFGGRISSVMDIHTKDGNLKEFHMNGRLGLVTTQLSLEGPLAKNKSSFFISGRRSYIDAFLSNEDFDEFYFADITGKINLKINDNNRLFLSVFHSNDEYIDDEGLAWKNTAGTIRWNHTFNDRLFANTTFYSSKYEYKLISGPNKVWKNHIANASIKTDFTFYRNPQSTHKFGFKLSGHNFNPGNLENSEVGPFVPKRNATEFSLYYSNERQLSQRWLLTCGVRLSTWANFGRTIEYTIDEEYQVTDTTTYEDRSNYNNYANLEPRINLTHILNDRNFLTFNYARSAQYINLISNSISPFNNLEVWLPASVNIEPQTANQISLGWVHKREKWQMNLEAYYKAMQNQIDYANQAELLLNPHFEAEIRSGKGTAYGLEAVISKQTGKLTGSVAYVLSRSMREIEGINDGKIFRALSDRPFQFSVNAVFRKSERSSFSGTSMILSGSPVTTPTSFYQYSGRTVPIYGEKNNDRLPTYHRLDLGWSYRLNKVQRKFSHFLSISLFNFYGQRNSVLRSFNKIVQEDDTIVVPTEINNPEELKATHQFVYQIVPSISYSFRL